MSNLLMTALFVVVLSVGTLAVIYVAYRLLARDRSQTRPSASGTASEPKATRQQTGEKLLKLTEEALAQAREASSSKQWQRAEKLYLQVLKTSEMMLEIGECSHEAYNNQGVALAGLGYVMARNWRKEEAADHYGRARATFERAAEAYPESDTVLRSWASALEELSLFNYSQGHFGAALRNIEAAHEKWKEALAIDPNNEDTLAGLEACEHQVEMMRGYTQK